MSDSTDFFNDYYAGKEHAFGKVPNQRMREFVLKENIGGNALDLGCGDGRNSLFLAELGMKVIAVDQSKEGIEQLNKNALQHGLDQNVETFVDDVRNFVVPRNFFDLISAVTIFDHFPEGYLDSFLGEIHDGLKENGILFVKVHTVDDPGYNGDSGQASELSKAIQHYFDNDELNRILKDKFDILDYEEYKTTDHTHGEPHQHAFAEAVARKK
ncbi:MAG: methyltransferase domain-containing protein [candidate division Zixibacteria bacterium]|nr:methyltransferase domain-containing protein [candidate division Zixibacteria bacterium]